MLNLFNLPLSTKHVNTYSEILLTFLETYASIRVEIFEKNMKEISNGYKILHTNTELVKHINGVDPKTSMDRVNLRQERIPLDRIERTYIQNCDTLAG